MRIGVDVGGTKIEGVAMDERSRLVVRERVVTPQDDYRATLETIAVVVRRLEASVRRQYLPVGVGHPGAISPSIRLLNNSNSTCLNGRPFQQDLEAVLGHEVYLANDADCLAMSEARYRTAPALWDQWVSRIELTHGESSGVRGAVFLCPERRPQRRGC